MTRKATFVVLDTNVYMHAHRFDTVDWHRVVGADSVGIALPAQVLRELDKHKDSHPSRTMRERVRGVIAQLKPLVAPGSGGHVRAGVNIEFYHPPIPAEQFTAWGLNPDVPDDRVLAAAMALQASRPDARVVLMTRDSTAQILGAQIGLEVIEIPGELELKPEPDPLERQLQQLRQENARLLDTRPHLSLRFSGGDQKIEITLPGPVIDPDDDEVERRLNQAAWAYPALNELRQRRARQHRAGQNARILPSVLDAGEVDRYESERAQYLTNLRAYFESLGRFRARYRRRFQVEFTLSNDGIVPADDITVTLSFPDGCDVETESTALGPPREPQVPVEPNAPRSRGYYDPASYRALWTEPANDPPIGDPIFLDVEHRAGSTGTMVVFRERKVQQAYRTVLGPLFVAFRSDDDVSPFTLPFELRADNMEPIRDALHLIVRRGE
jgi:hypothetical protein